MIKFELNGIDDLYKGLELRKNQVTEMRKEALEEGAKIIADEADSLAPENGHIHIDVKSEEAIIGFDKEKWYWRFFELGAKAHTIKGSPLVFEGDQGLVITRGVAHPGMAARPFLRPALDTKKDEAIKIMGEIVRRKVE
jgi:HK97 gp10 family phage protein